MFRLDNKKIMGEISEPISNQLTFSYTPNDKEYFVIANGKPYSLKKKDSNLIWDIPDDINKKDLKIKIQSIDPVKRNTLYTTNELVLNTFATVESLNSESAVMAFTTTSTTIYDSNYPFYNMIDEHSLIQIVERDILIPKNYKAVVSNDNNCQLLTFEANRYFDGVDRSEKSCWIRYVNSKNSDGETTAVNMQTTENKLIFGWLLDKSVSIFPGEVEFLIEFSGENEKHEPYMWQTTPAKLTVEKGLWVDNNDAIKERYPSVIENLQARIKSLEEFISKIDVSFNVVK